VGATPAQQNPLSEAIGQKNPQRTFEKTMKGRASFITANPRSGAHPGMTSVHGA